MAEKSPNSVRFKYSCETHGQFSSQKRLITPAGLTRAIRIARHPIPAYLLINYPSFPLPLIINHYHNKTRIIYVLIVHQKDRNVQVIQIGDRGNLHRAYPPEEIPSGKLTHLLKIIIVHWKLNYFYVHLQ